MVCTNDPRPERRNNNEILGNSSTDTQKELFKREALGVGLLACSHLLHQKDLSFQSIPKIAWLLQDILRSSSWLNLKDRYLEYLANGKERKLPGRFADRDPVKNNAFLEAHFGKILFDALAGFGKRLHSEHPQPALLCFQILRLDASPLHSFTGPSAQKIPLKELARFARSYRWGSARELTQEEVVFMRQAFSGAFVQHLQSQRRRSLAREANFGRRPQPWFADLRKEPLRPEGHNDITTN